MNRRIWAGLFAALLLAACGGGGSDDVTAAEFASLNETERDIDVADPDALLAVAEDICDADAMALGGFLDAETGDSDPSDPAERADRIAWLELVHEHVCPGNETIPEVVEIVS